MNNIMLVISAASLSIVLYNTCANSKELQSLQSQRKIIDYEISPVDIGECFQSPSDCYGGATMCYSGKTYTCIYQGHGKWCVISNHC